VRAELGSFGAVIKSTIADANPAAPTANETPAKVPADDLLPFETASFFASR
jgi:hypothetical protein